MNVKQLKLMGGIGSMLILLSFIPGLGALLALGGTVVLLVSLYYLGSLLGERSIFTNYLISIIVAFAGSIVALGTLISLIVSKALRSGFSNLRELRMSMMLGRDMRWFYGGNGEALKRAFEFFKNYIWIFLLVLAIFWIVMIISSIFAKMSLDKLSDKSNNSNFKMAGLFFLLGAVLMPFFGIGLVLGFVGRIFEVIGFFTMNESIELPVASQNQ